MRLLSLVLFALIADGAAWTAEKADSPQRHSPKGINFYSRTREMAMARDLSRDLERSVRIIEDPIVCEYVNRIAQTVARQADMPFSLTVRIIRSDEVNSIALPGGYIYIYSGLIRAAGSEAELAVAIAHEVGHVAARHYTRQVSFGDMMTAAQVPLLFIGGWAGMLAQEGAILGTPLAVKKFSRANEAEADRLGIRYAYDAGYDPTAFIDLMERIALQEQPSHGLAALLAEHPALSSRIRAAQKQIQKDLTPRQEYLIQTSEFEQVRQRLAGIESGMILSWGTPRPAPLLLGDPPVLRRHPQAGTSEPSGPTEEIADHR